MSIFSNFLRRRGRFQRPRGAVLETRFRNILHSYQALSAWNASGEKLLYIGFEDLSLGKFVIRDMASGEERVIGSTGSFNWHCGAWAQWALGDSAVLFRGQEIEGSPFLLPLDGSGPEPIPELDGCHVRQVASQGNRVVFLHGPTLDGRPARTGIFDLRERRVVFTLSADEAVAGISLGSKPDPLGTVFEHPVLNPGGTRIFFKLSTVIDAGNPPRERSFHAFDLNTRELTDFGPGILGHPAWVDERHIVNIEKTRDGADNRYLVAMDAATGNVTRLHDLPIPGAGHPAPSPDGRWIVTDSFTADGRQSILYLLDLKNGGIRELDRLDHRTKLQSRYDPSVITRAHPHPTWAPDSHTVLANCNFGGTHLGLVLWRLGPE